MISNKKLIKDFNKKFKIRSHFHTLSKKKKVSIKLTTIFKTIGERLKKLRGWYHPSVGWKYYRDYQSDYYVKVKISPTILARNEIKRNIIEYNEYVAQEERKAREFNIISPEIMPFIRSPLSEVLSSPYSKRIERKYQINFLNRMRGVIGQKFYKEIKENPFLTDWEKEAYLMKYLEQMSLLRREGIWGANNPNIVSDKLREIIFEAIDYDPNKIKKPPSIIYGFDLLGTLSPVINED